MNFTRDDYNRIINLQVSYQWLQKKQDELSDLLRICDTDNQKQLVEELLGRFCYLNHEWLNELLNKTADFIINRSGFPEAETQILAMTYDDEADSSQKVLDMIKMPLYKKGWKDVKTVNHYRSVNKNYKKGLTNLIFIDEFIGSGKTLKGRIKQLKSDVVGPFKLQSCFISGIDSVIGNVENETSTKIFCALPLKKGISECYKAQALADAEDDMLELELKLAEVINEKKLFEYSFGYGDAQALYTMEGCNGNTPNSVFPLFWWLKSKNSKDRKTLLTRVEKGF